MTLEMAALFCVSMAPVLLAWMWAKFTESQAVGVWLRRSAWVCGGVIIAIYAVVIAITNACDGNWLYGFRSCDGMKDTFANAAFMYLVLLFLAVAVYAVVLFVVSAIVEWRVRHVPDP